MKKQKRTWDGVCAIGIDEQDDWDKYVNVTCVMDFKHFSIGICSKADELVEDGKTKHDCPYWHEWPKEE